VSDELLRSAEQRDFGRLFIHDLYWNAPDQPPIVVELDGERRSIRNVSSYRGLRVWVCDDRPGSKLEAEIDRAIAKSSTDRLVIFHDDAEQIWRWPARRLRGNSTVSRLTRHRHRAGSPDRGFASRLEAIRLPEDQSLDANAVLAKLRIAFDVEAHNETKHASKLMARMYVAADNAYPGDASNHQRDHEISVTLARILFLMFGDDTEMWEADFFRNFVALHTSSDGHNVGQGLNKLFHHLRTPVASSEVADAAVDHFPYVNGGIFDDDFELPNLGADFRTAVLEACAIDWSMVSPAVFGSMFQAVRDARTRREVGEHYTSEENVLKTLNPLILDELRAEFERAGKMKNEKLILSRLWERLGQVRFLDPACGCGNFIIVAYRELRDIELRIMERLQELTGDGQLSFDPTQSLKVRLDHFYGIEIDEWPARIAEAAMFLVDRQCDLKLRERFGDAPKRLPIRLQPTIVAGVSALMTDWTSVLPPSESVVVAGNPPFLGISLRSEAQKAELKSVWKDRYHGSLDYVTGWYAKAIDYFAKTDGRWAFVSTNSVTQGEEVAPLFGAVHDAGWRISFAHRTFKWKSEAPGVAAVHCVIIGYRRKVDAPRLFDYESIDGPSIEVAGVHNITPYLTDGPSIIIRPSTKPLNSELGEVAYGNKPTDDGYLIVEAAELADVMADPIAARYVRRYVGARELLHDTQRHCLWLADATKTDLKTSEVLRNRVNGVRAFRAASKAQSTRASAATPHLFRQITQPVVPYLCIPIHVSEDRPYFLAAHFGPEVIASNANFIATDPDGFMFGVISSSMFITWQRTVGGRLESRLRFNKLLTWNTFPLPGTSNELRSEIIAAGAEILQARANNSDRSLADLYEPGLMSPALQAAHDKLDSVVDRLFGFEQEQPAELERQDRLFDGYKRLAGLAERCVTGL
jgi:hypothetical protein